MTVFNRQSWQEDFKQIIVLPSSPMTLKERQIEFIETLLKEEREKLKTQVFKCVPKEQDNGDSSLGFNQAIAKTKANLKSLFGEEK